MPDKRTCPCCGYRTLDSPDVGSYEICPVCFWEDDPAQAADPDSWGGANDPSLREAQRNFAQFEACDTTAIPHVRKPAPDEPRDPSWRPLEGTAPPGNPPSLRALEPQEIAVLADLALEFGLLETAAIVHWADSIIAAEEQPPYWSIELALAEPRTVRGLLKLIPGSRDDELPRLAFLALLQRHWENDKIRISEICMITRRLHNKGMVPCGQQRVVWGIMLAYDIEGYGERWLSNNQIQYSISKKLSRYACYHALIPDWMNNWDGTSRIRLYRGMYAAARDVLIREWDPIGVGDAPEAQDEYDSYIPGTLRMLLVGRTDQEIADYLEWIMSQGMGLTLPEGAASKNLRIARRLRESTEPFLAKPLRLGLEA